MEKFFEDNFALLFAASVVWSLLWVSASIVYRALKGREFPAVPEQQVRFSERWASGKSYKNWLTRLGGANNCLAVTLSNNALIVRPMFPFNLMFLPEIYDLEHAIPRGRIKRIEASEVRGSKVLIEYDADGEDRRILLLLRKREEFLRAVNE